MQNPSNCFQKIKLSLNNSKKCSLNNYDWRLLKQKILFALALIIVVFLIITITYTYTLNDYFLKKYQNEIQPQSEFEINQIVNEVRHVPNVSEKFNRIAEWEMQNFTDPYWEKYLGHNIGIQYLNPPLNTYAYNNNGKIRALASSLVPSPFANDPDWIQSNRFGACGEKAYLFSNVTTRLGYQTRIIVVSTGFWFYGIPIQKDNHAWVEINIDDEWYYFDPTVYGEYHVLNISGYNNRWFGKPKDYDIFSPAESLSVVQVDTHQDVSQRYPKLVYPTPQTYEELKW